MRQSKTFCVTSRQATLTRLRPTATNVVDHRLWWQPDCAMQKLLWPSWSPWNNDNIILCNNSRNQQSWQYRPSQWSDFSSSLSTKSGQPQTTNKLNWSWLINLLNELSITQNDGNIPSFARSSGCWSQADDGQKWDSTIQWFCLPRLHYWRTMTQDHVDGSKP